jgi:methionine-rich copper-binding protein CopC
MRKLAIGATALVMGVVAAAPALAHTSVYDSNPQDGASVDAAPDEVWVQFGNPMLPAPQPLAISGGVLEVFDACGEKVLSGETAMNDQQNQLTVASDGNKAGRYELIWTVEASDGEMQSGLIDFNVSNGGGCDYVSRGDTLKDVDYGFDIKSVKATQLSPGSTRTQVKLKKPITCRSLGKTSDEGLQLIFDTDDDGESNYTGAFTCKGGRFRVLVTEGESDAIYAVYRASLTPKGNVLSTKVRSSDLSDVDHLDIAAESFSEADECSEEPAEGEEAPVCSDRAPDLGVLRAF